MVGGLNLYAYAGNALVNRLDPLGLRTIIMRGYDKLDYRLNDIGFAFIYLIKGGGEYCRNVYTSTVKNLLINSKSDDVVIFWSHVVLEEPGVVFTKDDRSAQFTLKDLLDVYKNVIN